MAIITLTTDFGIGDYMVAGIKGAILKQLPGIQIVDISHEIEPFNLGEAAYVIKNVYPDFPEDTIHIIGVDALPNEVTRLLAAKIDGHYFVCADNGILSLILAELKPEELVEITLGRYNAYSNFPTRDIFVPVACHIARDGLLNIIGNNTNTYKHLNFLKPQTKEDKVLVGTVIYIDNFGNVITNISHKVFDEVGKGRTFEISVRNFKFTRILSRYSEIVTDFNNEVNSHGEKMVLFNSAGFLEIAIYKSNPKTVGSAKSLLGLKIGDNISVEFK
ncbi:hypothetical protein GO491_03570 [Flavobacteriaceae bacterium Ap0902]|nr:hypothetical protein [Flavobacteriaceae bacterium Ap0902]